jgi:hypothetical protein
MFVGFVENFFFTRLRSDHFSKDLPGNVMKRFFITYLKKKFITWLWVGKKKGEGRGGEGRKEIKGGTVKV